MRGIPNRGAMRHQANPLLLRSLTAAPSINARPIAASRTGRKRRSLDCQVHVCIPDAFADGTARPRSSPPEGRECGTLSEVARPYRCSKLRLVRYASRVYRQHDKERPPSLSLVDIRGHTTKSFLRQKPHLLMNGPIRVRNLRT